MPLNFISFIENLLHEVFLIEKINLGYTSNIYLVDIFALFAKICDFYRFIKILCSERASKNNLKIKKRRSEKALIQSMKITI